MRAREGSCLARVDNPQSAKRVNLVSQLKNGCSSNKMVSHLNCIHILEGIAVSLQVHPKGWERLEERGSRQWQIRRGDGDPGQGGHHTILMSLLK